MQHEETIFAQALGKSSPQELDAFLQQACDDNPPLRERVEALLKAHDRGRGVLDAPLPGLTDSSCTEQCDPPVLKGSGSVIGRYTLLEKIGEGGFGIVFMAEQHRPIRRRVALKILKPGMDTRQVIGRFQAERQALAMMDHPNIARVIDAGETANGRPYFVMELVHGVAITDYCDRGQLTPRQRLELFVPVCQAVQHAHQKGIIHRDLKPGNVLVTLQDGRPVPKVIDFGIAKALQGEQLTEHTLFTNFAQMLGTPLYMSPEQAEMNSADVDTRSDVYSLGVLLYELLTGTTPLDKERLKQAAHDEIRRIIREEDPPTPSTRLSSMGERLATVCAQRKLEPKTLGRLVRGELDWIVMRAMEKQRDRRYGSAGALGEEVQRYLRGDAVEASPPTRLYRVRKFASKYRRSLAAAAALTVVLAAATVVSTWQATRATRAERRATTEAERARGEAARADQERDRAEANFRTAREAVDNLFTDFAERLANTPHAEQIRQDLLKEALRYYQGFLQQGSTNPRIRHDTANAYHRVGLILGQLGRDSEAEQPVRQALAMMESLVAEYPDNPAYRAGLARLLEALGYRLRWSPNLEQSALLHKRALEVWERLAEEYPDNHTYIYWTSWIHTSLGNVLGQARSMAEGEQHHRAAVAGWAELRRRFPQVPEPYNEITGAHLWLGNHLQMMGQLEEAEQNLRYALKRSEQRLLEHPSDLEIRQFLVHSLEHLADVVRIKGNLQEGVRIYQRAIEVCSELHKDFPQHIGARRMLSHAYTAKSGLLVSLGRAEEAEAAVRAGLAIREQTLAESAGVRSMLDLGWSYYNLGQRLYDTGRTEEASVQFRKSRKLLEEAWELGPNEPDILYALAWVLAACPAVGLCDGPQAVEIASHHADLNPTSNWSWRVLGIAHYRAGDYRAAIDALNKSMDIVRGGDGIDWFFLAMAHHQLGNRALAREWYDRAVEWMQKHHPLDQDMRWFRAEAKALLGIEASPLPPQG